MQCRGLLTGRDTLDTTTTSETTDSGLGDTLDVVTKDLAVALGSSLSETLSSLSACSKSVHCSRRLKCRSEGILTSSHFECCLEVDRCDWKIWGAEACFVAGV
jgi:hypothetical protein